MLATRFPGNAAAMVGLVVQRNVPCLLQVGEQSLRTDVVRLDNGRPSVGVLLHVFGKGLRRHRARDEAGAWPVGEVRVSAEAAEKWSAFNASHSGSQTNLFYDITLTPTEAREPVVVQCPRTDSARTTIQALEDATGSKPSRITARRRKKQQRERAGESKSAEAGD